MAIQCPKCQSENPKAAKFCGECATPLQPSKDIEVTETLETPKEELTTGSVFAGRYQIIEELGKGGMGRVYKAHDMKVKEKIALKLIKPEIAKDKNTIERFNNELRVARRIRHKNVCQMFDLGEDKGTHFITMEFVEGQDLKKLIRQTGQLTIGTTINISKQVSDGLVEAHALGVVHRDLKPSNIMIDSDGNARIMDFGIARSLKAKGITGAGVMIGTPEYMSTEQVEGKEIDQRSDIYSLGVILYEMVTGRVPFEGDTPFTIGVKHKSEAPKNPIDFNAQIPEDLSNLILRCLEKDKDKRYKSAGEIRSELENIEKGIPTTEREIHRRKPTTSKEITVTLRKPWIMIAALFIVVIAAGIAYLLLMKEKPAPPTPKQNMLVVLPFENLGPPEDEYFADGITGEIIARLASTNRLGVIARTSAIQYKNTKKTIQDIGEELGVDYILEGTVRWQRLAEGPSRVRVTPLLIRVSDATNIWAEVYDKVIDEVFQVQSDIASKVVEALDIALLEPEVHVLETRPTARIEAYQAYLRGMDYYQQPDYSEETFSMAVRMFKRAVEIDPEFALAYAMLSRLHSHYFHEGYDHTEKRLALAKAAVDRALDLKPDLPEAHTSMGYYYYFGKLDYKHALEHLKMAQESQPMNCQGIGYIQRRQGRFEAALDNLNKAFLLDPRDAKLALEIGGTYSFIRRYEEAERYFDRSISLAPDQVYSYTNKARNHWLWEGATEKARATLEEIPKKDHTLSIFFRFKQELYERNYPAALEILSSASLESFPGNEWGFISKAQLVGQIYQLMNEPELARTSYESARIFLERNVKERADDPRVHSSLGLVYAALGRKAEAIHEGKLGVELYQVSKDALIGTARVEELALIYLMVGEHDAAIDQLEYLLSIPGYISIPLLGIDPTWDSLRDKPRFQKLLKREK